MGSELNAEFGMWNAECGRVTDEGGMQNAEVGTTQKYLGKISDMEALKLIENLYG